MRELISRFTDWLRRDRLDAELQEELRFHRHQLERDARAAGVAPDDAAWSARQKLGSSMRVTEAARDAWTVRWLDHLVQDGRYALRGLRRSPAFAAAVVLTLGLGIGANVAMFGVIDRLMFRAPPFLRNASRVDRVYLKLGEWQREYGYSVFPYTRYIDFARMTTSFSDVAAYTVMTRGVGIGAAARPVTVAGVSASYFGFFDAPPARGRYLLPDDDEVPAGSRVVVLSHDYWQGQLAGADVVGASLQVGNAQYTVVGVAPPGFVGFDESDPPAVYVPITAFAWNQGPWARASYFTQYSWDWVQMIVRRKPGVTRAAASADMTRALFDSWNKSRAVHPRYGEANRRTFAAYAGPLKVAAGPHSSLEARTLLWVTGVALIVFLIACANAANLCLARAMRRRREIALRVALGVSRARLAAQSLAETLVLAVIACALGVAIAMLASAGLYRLFLAGGAGSAGFDWRMLSVGLGAATLAALAAGLAPILLVESDASGVLKAGSRSVTAQRSAARATLTILQATLSVALLVGAGLFILSLRHAEHQRLGYEPERLLQLQFEPRNTPLDPAAEAALRDRMLETALRQPGIVAGAWMNSPVFGGGTNTLNAIAVPGVDSADALGRFTYELASADYFRTMGTRIVAGRAFGAADRAGAPRVVVVSNSMAQRLWPGQNALGRCVQFAWGGTRADTMPCTTVVGVAEDAVHDPSADQPLRYYLPEAQADFGGRTLVLRSERDPATLSDAVRRAVQAVMPGQALVSARVVRELVVAKRRSWTVGAALFAAFGALALLVAAIGLYAVIAYDVGQRMHEMGIRTALGARRADILRLVMTQGVRLAGAGIVIGSAVALIAAPWLQPLLFEQSARDPRVIGAVGALLLAVAALAGGVPAMRASRADPSTVLRSD